VITPGSSDGTANAPADDCSEGSADGSPQSTKIDFSDIQADDTVKIEYKIIGDDLGAAVEQDGTLTAGSRTGMLTVRATFIIYDGPVDDPNSNQVPNPSGVWYYKDIRIQIGGDGGCQSGRCGAGSGSVYNGAVNVSFNLGRDAQGKSCGSIRLFVEEPTPETAFPQSLYYIIRRQGIEVIKARHSIGQTTYPEYIRQVLVHEALADVIHDSPVNPNYRIDYYRKADVNPVKVNGLYVPLPGKTPYASWEVAQISSSPFKLKVTHKLDGAIKIIYEYESTGGANNWNLRTKNPDDSVAKIDKIYWTVDDERQYSIENAANVPAYNVHEDYIDINPNVPDDGQVWTTRVVDPGTSPDHANLTTTRVFYQNSTQTGKFKKLKSIKHPNGSWEWYNYDTEGRMVITVRSWLDIDLPTNADPDPADSAWTRYAYDPIPDQGDFVAAGVIDRRPRVIVSGVANDRITSKVFRVYTTELRPGDTTLHVTIEERVTDASLASVSQPTSTLNFGAASNLRTTWKFLDAKRQKLYSIEYPDGHIDLYTEEMGTFLPTSAEPQDRAFTVDANGTFKRTTIDHGYNSGSEIAFLPFKSTRDITIDNVNNVNVYSEMQVRDESGWDAAHPVDWTAQTLDAEDRVTQVKRSDGTQANYAWNCCALASVTDETGSVTEYSAPDVLGRVTTITQKGAGSQPDIVTTRAIDVVGRISNTTVSQGSLQQSTSTTFDLAGQIKDTTDAAGLTTYYNYCTLTGGARRAEVDYPGNTNEYPNGVTEDTDYYLDGRVKKVEGSSMVTRNYEYGLELSQPSNVVRGVQWTIVRTGNSHRWSKSWTDLVGRPSHEESPAKYNAYSGGVQVVRSRHYYYEPIGSFDAGTGLGRPKGALYRRKASTFTNSSGGGGGGPSLPNPNEYYSEVEGVFVDPDDLTRSNEGQSFNFSGAGDVFYIYERLSNVIRTGANVGTTEYPSDDELVLNSADRVTDTDSMYEFDDGAWWLRTETHVYPITGDGTTRKLTGVQRRQLTGFTGGVVSHSESHDIHGNVTTSTRTIDRPNKLITDTVTSPGSTVSSETITLNGLVQSTRTTSDLTYTYGYDGLGRRTTTTDPRTGTSTTVFDGTTGRVSQVLDAEQRTTQYTYDSAGRLKSVENPDGKRTYYAYNARGQITNVWGHVPQPVEIVYDSTNGWRTTLNTYQSNSVNWTAQNWPTDQLSPDTTTWTYDIATGSATEKTYADGKIVKYSFNSGGLVSSIEWARSATLNQVKKMFSWESSTGELKNITYSGSNNYGVTFGYDRLGRRKTIQDVQGTREFSYDPDTLQLLTEQANGLGNLLTSYQYETTTDPQSGTLAGRYSGFTIGTSSDTDSHYATDWTYDAYGRPASVRGPGLPSDGAFYTYTSQSDLIAKIDLVDATEGVVAWAFRAYEQHRDLVHWSGNKWQTSFNISDYDYTNDDLGRRTSVIRTGAAFTGTTGDNLDIYSYNARNELVGVDSHEGTVIDPPGTSITARNRGFAYDPIGNRINSTTGTDPEVYYCTNSVNAYTNLDDDDGCASPFTRSFAYDADANMTGDGQWTYVWDKANRLAEAKPSGTPTEGSKKLVFEHDYMDRRIRKKVFTYTSGAWPTTPTTDTRFIYDGWNLVLELDALNSNAVQRKFTWGLDLSGTRQGAGGIGGLLAVEDASGTPTNPSDDLKYLYFHDANGNVGQLIDWAPIADWQSLGLSSANDWHASRLVARYEYDAYGNSLLDPTNTGVSGAYAAANPFRFSSKYCEGGLDASATSDDLYYYGYRYYRPDIGRWINRDPIGEGASINLSEFLLNCPSMMVDPTGLEPITLQSPQTSTKPYFDCNAFCLGRVDYSKCLSDCLRRLGDRLPRVDKVEICCRDTEVGCPGDQIACLAGAKHCWLRTSRAEAGMGEAGGGNVAGAKSPCCGRQTEVRDHKGQGNRKGSECYEVPDCNEDCVNNALKLGRSLGEWRFNNQCNTFVTSALTACGCKNKCLKWSDGFSVIPDAPLTYVQPICLEWAAPVNLLPPNK